MFDTGPEPNPFDEVYIHSTYPAHLLGVCQTTLADGYHDYVVSTWGPILAIWYWTADINGDQTSSTPPFFTRNLNEMLRRSVEPLCISNDGVFMALGTHSGFDIFNITLLQFVQTGLGQGIYGLTKGAFSEDGRSIVVSTSDNKLYLFQLWGGQWDGYYPADSAPSTPVEYWPARPVDGNQFEDTPDTPDYDDEEDSEESQGHDAHQGSGQSFRSVPDYADPAPSYVEDPSIYHWGNWD